MKCWKSLADHVQTFKFDLELNNLVGFWCQVLQELVQDIFLPDSIYHSLPMQHLLNATADVVCWNNDIWSFPKVIISLTNLFNAINILVVHEKSHEEKCCPKWFNFNNAFKLYCYNKIMLVITYGPRYIENLKTIL
jgi:hypothetical protein